MKKTLLSIAGYDPTSGAGVLLDLKVFHSLDFLGMALLTAVTSQNTEMVSEIQSTPADFLWNQYQTLADDVSFSGIKVGMVGSKENIQVIARILSNHPEIPKVIDPVFKSSSGQWLFQKEAVASYMKEIRGKASLLTPNLDEAALISGMKVHTDDGMKKAAERIHDITCIPCLIKGGHLSEHNIDILFDGKNSFILEKERIKKRVHGTGCFLSSSLLAYLAKGNSLEKAFFLATKLTHKAIKEAIKIGRGQHIISL